MLRVAAAATVLLCAWDGKRDRVDGGPGRDRAWVDLSVDRVTRVERFR